MAYSVLNGAIGKSPSIDNVNLLSMTQMEEIISIQMKDLVYGHTKAIYPYFPVSFNACKKEMIEQLYSYQEKGNCHERK